jgi:DNA repair protein RadA/Sms
MKSRTIFVCQQCDAQSPKFVGRCTECGAWNSYIETVIPGTASSGKGDAARSTLAAQPVLLKDVRGGDHQRLSTGYGEIDRVLGGGIVPGSISLLGGEPGIGKSTLLIQAAARIGTPEQPVLYVSAEESPQQIKMRADRLGLDGERVALLAETDAETIIETARAMQPCLMIVDSIQTIATSSIGSVPGSISQVRECTVQLMRLAKSSQTAVLLIGHVTKDGTVAGPRALEHIVDAVLYLEGERFHSYRLLRSTKNRFGATEVGIFEMRGEGMVEVTDPSGIFLADRVHRATGAAVTISMEGTRPLLVEVQALASATSYGTPTRTVTGVDHTRLLMLLAVLSKRAGLRLGQHDVYINVVGGIELSEPAVDLGVAAAIASSFKERQIGGDLALIGEVGLGGELRSVTRIDSRLREAARLGFHRCIVPQANASQAGTVQGLQIIPVGSVAEAMYAALEGGVADDE